MQPPRKRNWDSYSRPGAYLPPLPLLPPGRTTEDGSDPLQDLVTRFLVPAAEEGERSGFYKYAMRTTIDFPIINFALRCGGNRPARLAAGALAPHPVVMAETAAKIDSDATDDEVIAQAEDELRKLAMPIKEACMTPAVKRSLYRHVAMLLDLRK